MKRIGIFAKILQGCFMCISTFHTLIHHTTVLSVNMVNSCKWKISGDSFLCQQLILKLPAHSHNLLKQFLDSMTVEAVIGKISQSFQLLQLSRPVQHFLSISNLIFCHLTADTHSFLKKLHDLPVDPVNILPKLA